MASPSLKKFGLSTYIGAGFIALFLLIGIATGSPATAIVPTFLILMLTGLYSLVTGRRSWARLAGRRAGAITIGATLIAFVASSGAVAAAGNHSQAASTSATGTGTFAPAVSPSATATATAASPSATPSASVTASPSPAAISPAPTPTDAMASSDGKGSLTVNAAGAALPDKAKTPGVANPNVTQANIRQTICVSGWTTTVRPSSSVTTTLKERQLTAGYNYQGDTNPADYEEDHLIPLELGGAPADPANLWPDPYNISDGAKVKDTVENKLHDLVCAGSLSLATAQQAIASDWWAAYETYAVPPAQPPGQNPSQGSGTSQPPTQDSGSAPVSDVPAGATAKCVDGTYSYSATHSGTCSHHKGVAIWYK